MSDEQPQRELPRYRSHKEVHALKISGVSPMEEDGSCDLYFDDEGFLPKRVSAEYRRKHNPQIGGYWVRYADGYESWSPAEAFESGYTRVN